MVDSTNALSEAANAASVVSGTLCAEILPFMQVFLTPVVILGTALAAWLVQRSILARRTAFDYIANHELHDEWRAIAEAALVRLAEKRTKDDWASIATDWSQGNLSEKDRKHIQPILHWLNRREFVSIGLLNGSIHQATYADWWGVPLIHEWKRAKPFVRAFRSTDYGSDGLFRKFEELATSQKFRQLAGWSSEESSSNS